MLLYCVTCTICRCLQTKKDEQIQSYTTNDKAHKFLHNTFTTTDSDEDNPLIEKNSSSITTKNLSASMSKHVFEITTSIDRT